MLLLLLLAIMILLLLMLTRILVYTLTTTVSVCLHTTSLWNRASNILNIWKIIDAWYCLHSSQELLEILTVYRYLLTIVEVILLAILG